MTNLETEQHNFKGIDNLHFIDTTNVFSHEYLIISPVLYYRIFGKIANQMSVGNLDGQKVVKWFGEHFKDHIKNMQYNRHFDHDKKKFVFNNIIYILDDGIFVDFEGSGCTLLHTHEQTATAEMYLEKIRKFKWKEREKPEISLLTNRYGSLSLTSIELKRTRLNIEENYNDDFLSVHKTILQRLKKKDDKGIVLLYGKPGTGKTTYIRHLISNTTKQMIFVPPDVAPSIVQPGFVNILIENPNTVLIIEDAENIILEREQSHSSAVSTLLNLSDGLLSDCLNIQIICSFNTSITNVDTALLRKGRLIAQYQFTELDTPKAQALSNKLHFKTTIENPMTLAEIYNQNDIDFGKKERKKIGFGA